MIDPLDECGWRPCREMVRDFPAGDRRVARATCGRSRGFCSGREFGYESARYRAIAHTGITDERQFYYRSTGLLRAIERLLVPPETPWVQEGLAARDTLPVTVRGDVGVFGYFAGPRVFIIDYYALADPLLAHLPALARWRVGHFVRRVPEGYEASALGDRNTISDPGVAAYYDKLRMITRGPLLNRARLGSLVALNLGRYEPLLKDYGWAQVPVWRVAERKAEGSEWDAPAPYLSRTWRSHRRRSRDRSPRSRADTQR